MVPRLALLVLAVVVARVGLLASRRLPDPAGEPVGAVLSATLVVVLVLLVRPRTRPVVAGLVGFGICSCVELLQLTPVVGALTTHWRSADLVLGTTFSAADLAWYAAGAALGAGAGAGVLRAVSRRASPRGPRRSRRGTGERPAGSGEHT
jgi:hypothetical protein